MTADQLEEMIKPTELAKLAHRSPRAVRDDCASGRLPAVKIGGHWRIKVSDAERYLAGHSWDERQNGH